jgi:hypothetical protein
MHAKLSTLCPPCFAYPGLPGEGKLFFAELHIGPDTCILTLGSYRVTCSVFTRFERGVLT